MAPQPPQAAVALQPQRFSRLQLLLGHVHRPSLGAETQGLGEQVAQRVWLAWLQLADGFVVGLVMAIARDLAVGGEAHAIGLGRRHQPLRGRPR